MNIQIYHEHCCGCGACSVVCSQHAISMKKNGQGFYYPVINTDKCIDCSVCVNSCSFNQTSRIHDYPQVAYVVKHKDPVVRAAARSGGIFTSLSDIILDRDGVVYGCILKDNIDAVHVRAVNHRERDLFHGSKYIQSYIVDCYEKIKQDLQQGKWVLFSGTACQVNAVRQYLNKTDCSRLLLIDIVCHGVPSQKVWEDYCTWVSRKTGKPITAVDFRDKKNFGWTDHVETFTFEDGTTYSCDYFKNLFYAHYILRKDCFDCPYKNLHRTGDITLADCWGITQQEPDFDDDKGVSLVLTNSERGKDFFNLVQETLNYRKVSVADYLQPPLAKNWPVPDKYDEFWKEYQTQGFYPVYTKYMLHPDQTSVGNAANMKKIGVLTFHFAHNCGAVLQGYALVQTIQKFRECEMINYQPDYHASWDNYRYHYEYPPRRVRQIWYHSKNKFRALMSIGFNLPGIMTNKKYRKEKKRTSVFEDFVRKYIPLSPVLHWPDEVRKASSEYAAVVTGSDQVWNPNIVGKISDSCYLLPFDNSVKKYSYAASAGSGYSDCDTVQMAFRAGQFDCVSVREEDLQQSLEEKNLHSRIDIDPSLLLEKEEYYPLEQKVRTTGNNFVFVYAFQISEELIQILNKLHTIWNCSFISYPLEGKLQGSVNFELIELNPLGPAQFLWLMHHAKYVVTSTFHGLAYAAVYEKEFVCLEPEHSRSRIDYFLSLTGLQDHYYSGLEHLIFQTNYLTFREKIAVERQKAIEYIKKICEDL